ncbi:hypothetical protein N1F28_20905 [Pseudomonas aeruginosa]|nr:hypothetical protein [Pseudomonas aeruginosa]MCS8950041.1 hypothetical protein [Pseudomonas aeruginosa]
MSADKIAKFVFVTVGAVAVALSSSVAGKFASDRKEKKRRKKLDMEHAMLEKKLKERNK